MDKLFFFFTTGLGFFPFFRGEGVGGGQTADQISYSILDLNLNLNDTLTQSILNATQRDSLWNLQSILNTTQKDWATDSHTVRWQRL